jgi:hypothetical protein
MIDTPIFELRIEFLMRNIEKICQVFGGVEPEQVSHGSDHEPLEGDRIVFAKLLMKERKKPEKFLLPHGRPSDDRSFTFSSRVPSKAAKIKALINYGIDIIRNKIAIKFILRLRIATLL